ncbi:MAG: DNA polymerase III subunit delta, partial [Cyclobacteriaceae bacterium]
MAHSPEAILKDLKQKKYAPVYFLQGDEPFYIDQITNYIEENVLNPSEKGFNQVVMYGKDVSMDIVMANAKRYPMMSDKQVVIVKEAQDIQDLGKEQGQKLLEKYLKNPLPSTILVFAHKYKTIGRNKTLGKTIDKFAVMVDSKRLYENQVPDWVESYIESKGFSIDQKARFMLAENIGNNLERLSNEIDKMLINLKEKVTIDEHMIQKYIGISKDYNVFELQKAISFRNIFKANQIVTY